MIVHRLVPTTAQHGIFCPMRFCPGLKQPSLDNLVLMNSFANTILMRGHPITIDD
uniref:Uncharacterized protein n=1 Tax=Octopus bimaculoides TaxID=37653 RepID=A0A0L8IBX1_OCTBM